MLQGHSSPSDRRPEQSSLWIQLHQPAAIKIAVIPPWFEGLDTLIQIPLTRPPENNILFMGAMQNPKNIEAIHFFATQVLPIIQHILPDAALYIVGGNPTPQVQGLASLPGVIVTGEVSDLTPYYLLCAVNVVPLLTGGGIIVKTLNGLASGRPTVSTPLGNSGITAIPEEHLLIVPPEPQAFADAVITLLSDHHLWHILAYNGRQFIEENYQWSQGIDQLEQIMGQICQKTI